MTANILIVDDDQEIRNLIAIYLENEGLQTFKAKDALDALRLLEKKRFDLIILDIMLPNMDGIEACIKIREEQHKKESQEYLDIVYSKAQRLKELVNELFQYTQLTSPDVQLTLQEIDLASLLTQVIGEYMPIIEQEQLSIEKYIPDEEVPVLIDVEKMVRVYENLLINVLKYSVKPSTLVISLDLIARKKVVFKVANKVKHPPTHDLNKLFERFYTADQARTEQRGTGLGLAISKRIVELHQGVIWAKYEHEWMSFHVEHPLITVN